MEALTILAVLFAAVSLFAAVWFRKREKDTLMHLSRMLDDAAEGIFLEQTFDESLCSAVEAKYSRYLSASAVSARNLGEEKDKIKTLIGDISHQTKTPLANILLYTGLLEEEALPESGRAYVEALGLQAQKLQFLIDALVKTSRLETGVLALRPKEHEVLPMLSRAVAAQEQKAAAKQIRVTLFSDESTMRQRALFDEKWTEEAVLNLLDNAIKYTQQGGEVSVRVTPYELFCRIDVEDNGIGISEEEQAKVFGRFYRGMEVSGEEGVGIGLYLVRQIISGEGGYLKVTSRRGEGSVFSVFLAAVDGRRYGADAEEERV